MIILIAKTLTVYLFYFVFSFSNNRSGERGRVLSIGSNIWPKGIIPYRIENTFNPREKSAIEYAIQYIEEVLLS